MDNPDPSIDFVESLFAAGQKYKSVYVDLTNVQTISAEAIALLIARLRDRRYKSATYGSVPDDENTKGMLLQSGFERYVRVHRPVQGGREAGRIVHRNSTKVEPKTAFKLIEFASVAISGIERRAAMGVYRIIIEGMTNTFEHAAQPQAPHETWWLSVYCDDKKGIANFTFLDNGVGIFQSVSDRIQRIKRAAVVLGLTSNAQILHDVLLGAVGSSTGLPERGKGLPSINEVQRRGLINRLTVITNDAYADVENGRYLKLESMLGGTLIAWELHNRGSRGIKHGY